MGSEDLAGIEAVLKDLRMKYVDSSGELQRLKRECVEETIGLALSIPGIKEARIKEHTETIDGIVIEKAEVSVTGSDSAKMVLEERSLEIKQKYMPLMSLVALRLNKVEGNLGVYLKKLLEFTVLEPLYERGVDAHAHIIIVHNGKVQEGQVHFSAQHNTKVGNKEFDASALAEIKARSLKSKCNAYIATHPSQLATHGVIFSYAQKQVTERIGMNYSEPISFARRQSLN